MRWGKWPILDLFSVLGWSFRAQKRDHVCECSQCFSCFCVFSHLTAPHNTHTIPHAFLSVSSGFQCFSTRTTPHNIHTHNHTRTTHNTPATDRDLESGLSKSHTRKNPGKCLKKAKSGETLARARADTDGQIVRLRRSDDRPIEPSGSWFPPKFPSFSRKKSEWLEDSGTRCSRPFLKLELGKILCLLPVNPSSK